MRPLLSSDPKFRHTIKCPSNLDLDLHLLVPMCGGIIHLSGDIISKILFPIIHSHLHSLHLYVYIYTPNVPSLVSNALTHPRPKEIVIDKMQAPLKDGRIWCK